MVGNIMRTLPESWQNDLLKSVQGVTPETTRELLPLLELLERSPPSGAMPPIPKKEKAADVPTSGSKRRGGKHGGGVEKSRKRGGLTLNRCKHCEKHGGPAHTHATEKCYKYNLDGTPKSSQVGKDKKAHKAFASIQSKIDKTAKRVQKLYTKQQKKDKKRSRRARYESSDSDSDSSWWGGSSSSEEKPSICYNHEPSKVIISDTEKSDLKNISSRPINATELNLVNKSVPIQENLTTKNLSGKEKKYF